MELELNSIQIFVSDIEKAKEWYSKILGMELIEEYTDIKCLFMKLGNDKFYIETPCPEWGKGWNTVKIGGRTPIIFETGNIKETVNDLKSKNVKFVEEISKRPWGQYKAVFADPDGNEFNLVQSE